MMMGAETELRTWGNTRINIDLAEINNIINQMIFQHRQRIETRFGTRPFTFTNEKDIPNRTIDIQINAANLELISKDMVELSSCVRELKQAGSKRLCPIIESILCSENFRALLYKDQSTIIETACSNISVQSRVSLFFSPNRLLVQNWQLQSSAIEQTIAFFQKLCEPVQESDAGTLMTKIKAFAQHVTSTRLELVVRANELAGMDVAMFAVY